MRKSLLPAG
uniref:Uncharacterized protein n=1 Tax=Timema douglasi TaxID=61478 RepID=A0A7R8W2Q9_TIMDO|nr:unnamed protein product [Timema douglasi]